MREQKNYNKVVNFDKETGEITVLDYVFEDGDFKGATGTKFEAVSKARYDEIVDEYLGKPQAISDYWEENVGEFLSYDNMVAISNDEDEIFHLCGGLDDSYSELWDYLREELNLDEEEAYMFNCIGGGRCFDKDFQGNYNPELSKVIREYEIE